MKVEFKILGQEKENKKETAFLIVSILLIDLKFKHVHILISINSILINSANFSYAIVSLELNLKPIYLSEHIKNFIFGNKTVVIKKNWCCDTSATEVFLSKFHFQTCGSIIFVECGFLLHFQEKKLFLKFFTFVYFSILTFLPQKTTK